MRTASFATSSMRCSPPSAPITSSSIAMGGNQSIWIAIKFASRKVDGLPLPRPLYEIFVYSPQVEGVHLRFGKVARGGIRWSDRPQDFRTEVLGLVKAQNVKNAVIVPVGAKGGFIPKYLPHRRLARSDPGRRRRDLQAVHVGAARHHRQYRRRHRGASSSRRRRRAQGVATIPIWSSPARDKGTATFSDIANDIAIASVDYWLGDAHSVLGGSAGYDHKKICITARGAWEGIGQTPFPRDGYRRRYHAVHRGRHRRYGGRRVRQRHVA